MSAVKPNFLFFVTRDSLLLLVAVLLWFGLAESQRDATALGDFFGVIVGAALVLGAHLLHEWGHLLGGLAGRSAMRPADSFSALSIFAYAPRENSIQQFLLMSFGGFAFTAAVVWFSFAVLPDGYLATHIARGYAVLQVVLALLLEVPLVFWALIRKEIPPIDTWPNLGSLVPKALLRR
ncbi:MAG: hypothetical protein KJP25_07145 [Gammaproteobacteria bacterium]|nr:hypothetical protein [Gammaproteobacteria bacterium]NND38976.1 hypothetical protein [Pseudomonadales bacterium]MBT8151749.1 hypothetical protein [Gammaproteobacteria bacterium]NNL11576.1 hypothetical protein [Pseudomonadales bacterium]NNM10960.1 hypothetical protein [Pseudomonadales bacterium]